MIKRYKPKMHCHSSFYMFNEHKGRCFMKTVLWKHLQLSYIDYRYIFHQSTNGLIFASELFWKSFPTLSHMFLDCGGYVHLKENDLVLERERVAFITSPNYPGPIGLGKICRWAVTVKTLLHVSFYNHIFLYYEYVYSVLRPYGILLLW